MIAYKSTSKKFIEDVEDNSIGDKIKAAVLKSFGWNKVRSSEEDSWSNSMQFMGNVIRKAAIADNCGILIEYNLPSTSLRVDFIISGEDKEGKPGFIIVELKQWKEANSTLKDGIVNTPYHGNEAHPSYQAYSYKLYLKDFNEYIYTSSLRVSSCAFLHNYVEKNPEPLKESIYSSITRDSPLYFKHDQQKLEEFIFEYIGKGNGERLLYEIEQGKIRPSKKLIEHVTGLFDGNSEFVLLDQQKVAFENAKDLAINSNRKTIIIIKGGPGTGKSVISMNLLGTLLKANKNVLFVAPNASFREVMVNKLTRDFGKQRIRHLLRGSSAFYGARENTFDILIVDEAHRLKNGDAFMYKGKNQVEDIIQAGRISIFFIDEKQMIRPDDICTINEILRIAELHNASVEEMSLTAQFRCSGAEGYLNWVDDVLQIQSTGNFDGWDNDSFEFKICGSPNELRTIINEKNVAGFNARILAGYAWKWTAGNLGNPNSQVNDVIIKEFDFEMPWNSRLTGTTWAIEDSGINQIGCVHTSQGLEFDYAGVIIGKDLQFDKTKNHFFTLWNEYKDSKGKQGLKEYPLKLNELVRNIYRILLTRGMKGCYVYFVDKEAERYFKKRLKV